MASQRSKRILILLSVHFVAGILAAFPANYRPSVSTAVLVGLVFCQATLLGMWTGLGATHWRLRLFGAIAGTVYLYVELGVGTDSLDLVVFWMVAFATALVAGVCQFVRRLKVTLSCEHWEKRPQEGLQFTIRHLMVLTFVVASLMAAGRYLAPYSRGINFIPWASLVSICFASVAVMSLWTTLGFGNTILRCTITLLVAASAGACVSYSGDRHDLGFWMVATLLQSALLLGSLWVVRSTGYRLVRKRQG